MAEKKIGGRVFQVGHVLATDAVRLQARLLKLIGGGVERLPTILRGVGKDADPALKEASNAAAVAALTDIFGKSDPDEVTRLIADIVAFATVKQASGSWGQVDMDQDFTEHKADLFPVVIFVLKEVLGDFFSGLPDSGKLKQALGA